MRFLGLTRAVVGVTVVRAALDLNGNLVAKLALEVLLNANIRIAAERDYHFALRSVEDGDLLGIPSDDELPYDFTDRKKSSRVACLPIALLLLP
jgi:hypothetical protein